MSLIMFFFVFLIMLFLSFLNFCFLDYFLWWSIFVACTFVFVFFSWTHMNSSSLMSYFMIQEVCGYYFLFFGGWKLQFLILLLKSGSAPFHFWLFSVLHGVKKWFFVWFLTFQKLPYLFAIVSFCSDTLFFILLSGMLVCYVQFFFSRDLMSMVTLASVESFNWLLLLSIFSINEALFYILFYYSVMFLIIFYFVSGFYFFGYEFIMVLFNAPLMITFFLKLLVMFGMGVFMGFYYLILLYVLAIMCLVMGYWFFLFSVVECNFGVKYFDCIVFALFCFMFLVYF